MTAELMKQCDIVSWGSFDSSRSSVWTLQVKNFSNCYFWCVTRWVFPPSNSTCYIFFSRNEKYTKRNRTHAKMTILNQQMSKRRFLNVCIMDKLKVFWRLVYVWIRIREGLKNGWKAMNICESKKYPMRTAVMLVFSFRYPLTYPNSFFISSNLFFWVRPIDDDNDIASLYFTSPGVFSL